VPTVLTKAKQPAWKIQARLVFIASKALKLTLTTAGARQALRRKVRTSPQEADFAGLGFAAGTSPSAEM
jgi:hypothetical protein